MLGQSHQGHQEDSAIYANFVLVQQGGILKMTKMALKLETPIYSLICRGQKGLDNSSTKTPSMKGVSFQVVITFFFLGSSPLVFHGSLMEDHE